MTLEYRKSLLDDTNQVISYAARAGVRLNEKIYISRDYLSDHLNDVSVSTTDLEGSLSEAIQRIQPITLLHLRNKLDPFSFSATSGGYDPTKLTRRTLFTTAAFLLVSIISVTFHVKEIMAAAKALSDQSGSSYQHQFQKILWELQAPGLKDRESMAYALFEEDIAELLRSANQRVSTYSLTDKALHSPKDDFLDNLSSFSSSLKDSWRRFFLGYPSLVEAGNQQSSADYYAGKKASEIYKSCYRPSGFTGPPDDSIARWLWVDTIINQQNTTLCLNEALALGVPVDATFEFIAFNINERLELYSKWILPLLYGALGSVIFLFRNLGNVRTPDLSPAESLLRIGLGAVAGVAIGWFSHEFGTHETTLTDAPSVLAFIAGFSTDIFFAAIDRVIITARDSLAKNGGQ